MTVRIQSLSVDEVFDAPVFADLCEEYRVESLRNPDLLGGLPDRAGYQAMFDAGFLYPLGVFAGDELVGLCAVMITPVLHFGGKLIATTETLFVAQAHRAGGAGQALLRAAQDVARAAGAAGLYINAPVGGRLARILPRQGYHMTNQTFYRGFA